MFNGNLVLSEIPWHSHNLGSVAYTQVRTPPNAEQREKRMLESPLDIDYTLQIWQEGNAYIAHAMPLDVASSGPTADAARLALDEAVRVFLATATDMGTIEQVLEEAGYSCKGGKWVAPAWIGVERHTLSASA